MTRVALPWLVALLFVPMVAFAGTDAGQSASTPPPRNLVLIPKDTDPARLVVMMRGFADALGVTCQHCHVLAGTDPGDLSAYDFASDDRPAKLTARRMMQAVQRINADVLRDIGAPRPPGQLKVGCYTCHRGALVPAVMPPR